jgi:biotin carboxylase
MMRTGSKKQTTVEREQRTVLRARPRILVEGVGHAAGHAMVRDLSQLGFEIIGLDSPPNLRSPYFDDYRSYSSPLDEGFADRLLAIISELAPDVVLPLSTKMARILSENAVPQAIVPPADAFHAAFDKMRTQSECRRLGIPAPRILELAEARELVVRGESVVVKPALDMQDARGVVFVSKPEELDAAVDSCRTHFGEPLIQEFIPGGAEQMRTALVLFDKESQLIAHFTTRKVRQMPYTGGNTAASVSTQDRSLVESVLPFFEKFRWRGPAEVEFKVDPRDGKAKVIEVNPRFPGYVRFPIGCGLRVPTLAVLDALGRPLPTDRSYQVDARYVRPDRYLRSIAGELRREKHRLAVLRRVMAELTADRFGILRTFFRSLFF